MFPPFSPTPDYYYGFWLHFGHPGLDGRDRLLGHILSLMELYLLALPGDDLPKYPLQWAQMYDRQFNARYAISLGFVFSVAPEIALDGNPPQAFADQLNLLASNVKSATGLDVGFLLDVWPAVDPGIIQGMIPPHYRNQDASTAFFVSPEHAEILSQAPVLAIRPYRSDYGAPPGVVHPDILTGLVQDPDQFPSGAFGSVTTTASLAMEACLPDVLAAVVTGEARESFWKAYADNYRTLDECDALNRFWVKRKFITDWIGSGIPFILDFTSGYDGHLVFGMQTPAPNPFVYGNDDRWRNDQACMRGLFVNGFTQAGLSYTDWNAYTEGQYGMAVVEPGRDGSPGYAWNQWLQAMLSGDPTEPYYVQFDNGVEQILINSNRVVPLQVYGLIGRKWVNTGGVRGPLGKPTGNEDWGALGPRTRRQFFEHGVIIWDGVSLEAYEVHGAIFDEYNKLHLESGEWGLPVSDEHDGGPHAGCRVSCFEGGVITWCPGDAQASASLGAACAQ